MKKLLFLLAFPCFAQINYDVVKQTALSGAAEKITVQTPSTSPRLIKFVSAYADCSVACNLTLSLNGTNATTTSLTVNKLDSTTSAATAVAFSSSDVGTGSASYGNDDWNLFVACRRLDLSRSLWHHLSSKHDWKEFDTFNRYNFWNCEYHN